MKSLSHPHIRHARLLGANCVVFCVFACLAACTSLNDYPRTNHLDGDGDSGQLDCSAEGTPGVISTADASVLATTLVSLDEVWLGFEFEVQDPQTVIALGAWQPTVGMTYASYHDSTDTTTQTRDGSTYTGPLDRVPVGLYEDNSKIAEVDVVATSQLIGLYRYECSEVALAPDKTYVLVASFAGPDPFGFISGDANTNGGEAVQEFTYNQQLTPRWSSTHSPVRLSFAGNIDEKAELPDESPFGAETTTGGGVSYPQDRLFHVNLLLKQ